MTRSGKSLCILYAFIAALALVGTWGNVLEYLELGIVAANIHFWKETLANPASRFITVDVLFLALAVIVWMLREARRLKMRGVWLYVVGGFLVAISVAYPLFMIHRERVLGASPSDDAQSLGVGDKVGLAILSVMFVAYAAVALSAG